MTVSHAFAVRDISPGTNDGELPSPDRLRESKKGSVDVGPWVPITGDQKHVLTDVDPRFMYPARRAGSSVLALHINIS